MLTRKTVLVLGAGASSDYGLPLGVSLRKDIISLTGGRREDNPFVEFVRRYVPNVDYYACGSFSKNFRDSGLFSIDSYLSFCVDDPARQPEVEVGKRALAWIIASRESVGWIDKFDRPADSGTEDWYQYLWNNIVPNFKDNSQSLLSIVTFNYDRSLEIYLVSRIMKTFNCGEEDAWRRLSSVEIIHVYGQLGELRQAVDGKPNPLFRKYSFDSKNHLGDWQEVEKASHSIRVIGDRHNNTVRARIRELLRSAVNICFLGFAYDLQNLRALGFASEDGWNLHIRENPEIEFCGSAFKLTSAEVYSAAKFICPGNPNRFKSFDAKCLDSLRLAGTLLL